MTYHDLDLVDRIPDRWIDSILSDYAQRHPDTHHRPSRRTIRGVLVTLATRIRKPDKRHSRADEAYTDETRPQIALTMGISDQTVGDALAVIEYAQWARVVVRGRRGRGSCRTLPILDVVASMTADDLSGDSPTMIDVDLNGTTSDLNGTTGDLNGISRDLGGDDPIPPDISRYQQTSARAPAAASNGGTALALPDSDGNDDATIAAAMTDERSREIYLRGIRRFRT